MLSFRVMGILGKNFFNAGNMNGTIPFTAPNQGIVKTMAVPTTTKSRGDFHSRSVEIFHFIIKRDRWI